MSRIIRFPEDKHRETQALLPWYVSGTLAAGERTIIEAHLADCARCREDLQAQRQLKSEIADLPLEADRGWQALCQRIETPAKPQWKLSQPVGWLIAAQIAFLAILGGMTLSSDRTGVYRTLSNPSAKTSGNAIVMFRPDASVQDMRSAIETNHARLVDGPTAAGAYVLAIAEPGREKGLEALRQNSAVILAEPINGSNNR
jgi:hypothetical protein